MKTKQLALAAAFVTLLFSAGRVSAQVALSPIFSQLRLEARADFDFQHLYGDQPSDNPYGFHGRYFNFVMGGNLNDKFSYYFRQRIIANDGTASLFDNTDFLYLNYRPNEHWLFRLGKDALAVGGFEYDAPPIDVLFSTVYWNNFYCFQLGGSAAYTTKGGKNTIMAQVANSPTVYYGAFGPLATGTEWRSGLLAYSLYWAGNFGHFKTLYSVNMFERPDENYMNYIALGHKLVYDRWDIYLDLFHHALANDDWGKDLGFATCFNYLITDDLNLFAKCSYEQNFSEADFQNLQALDFLVESGHSYWTYGLGFEYHPAKCKDVRIHGFVANRNDRQEAANGTEVGTCNTLTANVGITWHMNIHRMFQERNL